MAIQSWPPAVYPNLLLLPAAMMLGMTLAVLMASFKKYLQAGRQRAELNFVRCRQQVSRDKDRQLYRSKLIIFTCCFFFLLTYQDS